MRPTSGTLTNSRRYSRSESSVFIAMANRSGRSGGARTSSGVVSNVAASAPLASISHTSVRLPDRAREVGERGGDRRLADAALAGDEQQVAIEQAAVDAAIRTRSAAEADAAVAVVRADLDVGDLRRRDADPPAPLVGEPQHVDGAGRGRPRSACIGRRRARRRASRRSAHEAPGSRRSVRPRWSFSQCSTAADGIARRRLSSPRSGRKARFARPAAPTRSPAPAWRSRIAVRSVGVDAEIGERGERALAPPRWCRPITRSRWRRSAAGTPARRTGRRRAPARRRPAWPQVALGQSQLAECQRAVDERTRPGAAPRRRARAPVRDRAAGRRATARRPARGGRPARRRRPAPAGRRRPQVVVELPHVDPQPFRRHEPHVLGVGAEVVALLAARHAPVPASGAVGRA